MTDNNELKKISDIEPLGDLDKAADLANEAAARTAFLVKKAKGHIFAMCFRNDINKKSQYKPITEPDYTKPTGDNVGFIVNVLIAKGYNKADIARLIDVSPTKNRTIDRWIKAGDQESVIPYGAWRLLCAYAGYTVDYELPEKE